MAGERSHWSKHGRLALVHPDPAVTEHPQAPKSVQAQDAARGQVGQGTHSYLRQCILWQLHQDKFVATVRDVVFGLVCCGRLTGGEKYFFKGLSFQLSQIFMNEKLHIVFQRVKMPFQVVYMCFA